MTPDIAVAVVDDAAVATESTAEVEFAYNETLTRVVQKVTDLHAKQLARAEERVAQLRDALSRRLGVVGIAAQVQQALDAVGLHKRTYVATAVDSDVLLDSDDIFVGVDAKELPRVRQALGRLTFASKSLCEWFQLPNGAEGDWVQVILTCERYPTVTVSYKKPLESNGPCQVVTETKSERKLVCSVHRAVNSVVEREVAELDVASTIASSF